MSTPLWDKGKGPVDAVMQKFLAGEDVLWDRHLFPFDVEASRAHARGLQRIGILSADECTAICTQLDAVAQEFLAGTFVLDEKYEDCHSAIEDYLTQKLGAAGRKVHTGRSRNDQILVATRLFLKDALARLEQLCRQAGHAALNKARAHEMVPMPGYTHLQRAVPSSVGLWMAAFAEAFADDAHLARMTRGWLDASPLGTAAGYGVNLPLDRDGVSQELGFARLQINPMYAQNSRGKFELQALGALSQALLDVRRLAWDLSLFTTEEFGFVRLPDAFTTGSSIMPNKRNPDVVELLRAAHSVVTGAVAELTDVLSLTSGYHRDLQATKGPVLRAFQHGLRALALVPSLVDTLEFDVARMRAAISPEMFATDRAVELAVAGVPFRDAYRQVAQTAGAQQRTPEESLTARTSPGATALLLLDRIEARLSPLPGASG